MGEIRPNARHAFCVRGHAQTPANRYLDRWCRPCRAERARAYRAEGMSWGRPGRSKENYWKNVTARREKERAAYKANSVRRQKQRIIQRLRKRVDLSDNEVLYLRDLIAELAATPLVHAPERTAPH